MIEQALFEILTGHPGLSALVSNRVYPLILPEDPELPAITYQRITTTRGYTVDGPDGAANPTFQITIWNPALLAANQVAGQVRAAVHAAWRTVVADVSIGSITVSDDRNAYDQNGKVVGIEFDVTIWHRE